MERSVAARMRRGMYVLRRARELGLTGTISRAANALRRLLRKRLLVRAALVVRQRTGKSLRAQARELIRLRLGPGQLDAADYYAYELFDDRRYSLAEKREFVSWPTELLGTRLNDVTWAAVCDDKLVCYALMRGLGLPHPEVYAIYHPGGRTFGPVPSLRTPQELAAFLREGMCYPFFGKPVRDAFGRGASSVEALDRDRDVLILTGREEISVDEYVRQVPVAQAASPGLVRLDSRWPYRSGYLFQARVRQHPLIDRLSGGRVSTLRLVVLLGHEGPRLFRVTWKLPVGNNITDHVIGTSGNLKCSVDPATGWVERVVQGPGPEGNGAYGLGLYGRPVEAHPDTQERLAGVQLPDWERTVAVCLHAAAALPGLCYQSWDVALGVDGPMILELNFTGGIAQVPGCRGLNDAQFREFMASVRGA